MVIGLEIVCTTLPGRNQLAQHEVDAHPVGRGLVGAVGEQPAVEVFH